MSQLRRRVLELVADVANRQKDRIEMDRIKMEKAELVALHAVQIADLQAKIAAAVRHRDVLSVKCEAAEATHKALLDEVIKRYPCGTADAWGVMGALALPRARSWLCYALLAPPRCPPSPALRPASLMMTVVCKGLACPPFPLQTSRKLPQCRCHRTHNRSRPSHLPPHRSHMFR